MLCFVAPLPPLVEAGESEEQRPRCSPIAPGTPRPSAGLVPSPAFCSYACLLMGFLPHHKNIRKITLANSFVCHSAWAMGKNAPDRLPLHNNGFFLVSWEEESWEIRGIWNGAWGTWERKSNFIVHSERMSVRQPRCQRLKLCGKRSCFRETKLLLVHFHFMKLFVFHTTHGLRLTGTGFSSNSDTAWLILGIRWLQPRQNRSLDGNSDAWRTDAGSLPADLVLASLRPAEMSWSAPSYTLVLFCFGS